MKKLRLEELAVDSFITSSGGSAGGTVRGMSGDNCWTNTNSVYSACPTCGSGGATCTDETADADCTTGGGGTRWGMSCDMTCIKGQTDCGTCAPAASCDLQYGCSGTSFDLQPC